MPENNNLPQMPETEPAIPYADIQHEETGPIEMELGPDSPLPEEPSIANDSSSVGSAPARNIVILIIAIVTVSVLAYLYLFKEDPKTIEDKKSQELANEQPVEQAKVLPKESEKVDTDFRQVEEPSLPDIGPLANKEIPAPPTLDSTIEVPSTLADIPSPPSPQAIPAPPVLESSPAVQAPVPLPPDIPVKAPDPSTSIPATIVGPTAEEIAAANRARRQSAMLVANGGGEPNIDKNAIGADGTLRASEMATSGAAKSLATKLGNTDYMIAQGKMVGAVLETAINTDLPGSLRAVISRDVYGESGRHILIPKGSRLLGTYDNAIQHGQRRVLISWDRLILPNGIDIQIGSPGTDRLGRSGVKGFVDNKYFELFKNSILLSSLTIAGSFALDKAQGGQGGVTSTTSTSTNGDSSSTQSGTSTDFAVLNAVDDLSNISTKIAEGLLNAQPTITVDQGTIINVFVNRDLVFPADKVSGGLRVVQ